MKKTLETTKLLSTKTKVCEEAVRSIMLGIALGDEIPPIEVVRIKEGEKRDKYLIWDGDARAKAHCVLGLPVETIERTVETNELPYSGKLTDIGGLGIISDPNLFDSKKCMSFYRDFREEK